MGIEKYLHLELVIPVIIIHSMGWITHSIGRRLLNVTEAIEKREIKKNSLHIALSLFSIGVIITYLHSLTLVAKSRPSYVIVVAVVLAGVQIILGLFCERALPKEKA